MIETRVDFVVEKMGSVRSPKYGKTAFLDAFFPSEGIAVGVLLFIDAPSTGSFHFKKACSVGGAIGIEGFFSLSLGPFHRPLARQGVFEFRRPILTSPWASASFILGGAVGNSAARAIVVDAANMERSIRDRRASISVSPV